MSRVVLALVCCSSLMGCLITRDPTYSPPRNTPAVVLESSEQPFGRFIDVRLDRVGIPDAGVGQGNPSSVLATIRDPDIDQELTGLLFIDRNPDSSRNIPEDEFRIPPTDSETRSVNRPFDFGGLFTASDVGCHVLELHVAQQFTNILNPVPAPDPNDPDGPTDLGRGVWFIRVLESEVDDTALRGCEVQSP